MNRLRRIIALGVAVVVTAARAVEDPRPGLGEEVRLIQILQSSGPVTEKDAACVRLQRIGTERSVPALAALLGNPQLGHVARYALESMPFPAAGAALVNALTSTTAGEQIGVVGSLAVRREDAAAPGLARLLDLHAATTGSDELALAVATALGEMDSPVARAALERAWATATATWRAAVGDALLRQAYRALGRGARAEAALLFEKILHGETRTSLQVAAYQGVIRAARDDEALRRIEAALVGPPGPEQAAALRLVPDWEVSGVEAMFARLLPTLPPPMQAALLGAWLQRVQPPDRTVLLPLLESAELGVRFAAVRGLGRTGDVREVPLLLGLAAAAGPLRDAARLSLAELPAPAVSARLMELLQDRREGFRIEAARALGARGDSAAVPPLLEMARTDASAARVAAWRALTQVAGEAHCESLLRAVATTVDLERRHEGARAIALLFERLQPPDDSRALQALIREVTEGDAPKRVALLPACSALSTPAVRRALRAALIDSESTVRAAAVRSAARTSDVDLLPDLLRTATTGADEESRELASRACVRLVAGGGEKGNLRQRSEVLRALAATALTLVQKRAVLGGLAEGRTLADLELIERYLADADTWTEAVAVTASVAPRLAETGPSAELLRSLLECAMDPELRRSVEGALRTVESRAARNP